ncbi:MAG: MMPL family transporter [Coriobacteriia bacterium]
MLRRFARAVVKGRRAVLAVAALLLVGAVFGMMNLDIQYDMLEYVPDELESVQGFDVLQDDFALGNTAQILLVDVDEVDAGRIVERLRDIEGIERVGWVTDFNDLTVPREWWDEEVESTYFAGEDTFIQVSFAKSANDPATRAAVEQMREVLAGHEAYVGGIQQLELEDVINRDRARFAAAALILVTIALLLTVPSIVIPVLFVITIGAAVFYNLGLSYYLGQQTSYLTGVIVFALQFAVTMDYALFLYHRYEQEPGSRPNEEAMEVAIASTFKSVAAASATTIAGFLALTAMRLEIGADMGLTLARGVLLTVIAVLTILPALMLEADPLVRRLSHKVHLPHFGRLGGFLAGRAGVVTLVMALAFVPAVWAYSQLAVSYDLDKSLPEDLPSLEAGDRIAEAFGRHQTDFVILEDTGDPGDVARFTDKVRSIEGVSDVFSYTELVDPLVPDEFIPEEAREAFYKNGRTYVSVDVAYEWGDDRTDRVLADLHEAADTYPGQTFVTGQAVLLKDMEATSAGDVQRVNWISVAAVALIIAIAFRSLAAPAVLLGAIQLAILANQGFAAFSDEPIIFIAQLAIGAIQLGATVDYAILLTSRYEEELTRQPDREQAMRAALDGAAPSILVSASTMFAATIGIVFLSSVATITDLTALIARGAVISFFVVVFLLPGALVYLQPLMERLSLGWPKAARRPTATEGTVADA